ncbi:dynein axonemal heavy chain 8-like [Chrysoperla carnea]|uniref:dynein axonemal heavy chain 8-like n=1 Tax=Chrysoperla carnea TaxID=189513 RepID=UPI001D071642|nr:dynein axonemal heavy chain 8-like [Chrysoperla carnea]
MEDGDSGSQTSNIKEEFAKERIRDRKPKSRAISVTQSKLNLRAQMKLLEEDRQDRESQIGSVHRYILDSAALLLGVTVDELVEGIIDSDSYIETFNTLFQPGGRCVGIIHYQMGDAPDLWTGRYNPTLPKGTKIKSAAFSSGDSLALTDMGVLAYRLNAKKPIETKNVADDIYVQAIFASPPEKTVCDTIVRLLETSIVPAIHGQSDWGELNKTEPGHFKRNQFLDKFDRFIHYMKEIRNNVDARVTFHVDDELFQNYLHSPAAAKQALSQVDVYKAIHSQVRQWIRQMNHVIVERNQLRREDDSFGPFKELDYWRRELAKFESVIEQIKSKKCHMYIFYVMASKCDLGKV